MIRCCLVGEDRLTCGETVPLNVAGTGDESTTWVEDGNEKQRDTDNSRIVKRRRLPGRVGRSVPTVVKRREMLMTKTLDPEDLAAEFCRVLND
jgi:hypothetical protein